ERRPAARATRRPPRGWPAPAGRRAWAGGAASRGAAARLRAGAPGSRTRPRRRVGGAGRASTGSRRPAARAAPGGPPATRSSRSAGGPGAEGHVDPLGQPAALDLDGHGVARVLARDRGRDVRRVANRLAVDP